VVSGGRYGYNAKLNFIPGSELFAILDALAEERPIDFVVASDQHRTLGQHNLLGAPDSSMPGILKEGDLNAIVQCVLSEEWVFIAKARVATVL
jgi:hypothetical protein